MANVVGCFYGFNIIDGVVVMDTTLLGSGLLAVFFLALYLLCSNEKIKNSSIAQNFHEEMNKRVK